MIGLLISTSFEQILKGHHLQCCIPIPKLFVTLVQKNKIVDEVLPNTGMEAALAISSKPYSIFMSSPPKDAEKL